MERLPESPCHRDSIGLRFAAWQLEPDYRSSITPEQIAIPDVATDHTDA